MTLNQKIAENIKYTYFPLLKQKYEIFQVMLKNEEKMYQRNVLGK